MHISAHMYTLFTHMPSICLDMYQHMNTCKSYIMPLTTKFIIYKHTQMPARRQASLILFKRIGCAHAHITRKGIMELICYERVAMWAWTCLCSVCVRAWSRLMRMYMSRHNHADLQTHAWTRSPVCVCGYVFSCTHKRLEMILKTCT